MTERWEWISYDGQKLYFLRTWKGFLGENRDDYEIVTLSRRIYKRIFILLTINIIISMFHNLVDNDLYNSQNQENWVIYDEGENGNSNFFETWN